MVGGWRTKSVWELADTAAEGNAAEALKQLDKILQSGEKPIAIFGQLSWALRRYAVATRMFEINPKDPIAMNNVVSLSLLLHTDAERILPLADQLFSTNPKHPGIVSTYAYSLHIRGKTGEGIALMRSLDEKVLSDPTVAAYFAAMLAESAKPEETEKYIELAQAGKLLPEEMELVNVARETMILKKAGNAGSQ